MWFGVLSSWFEMVWEIVLDLAQLPLLTGTKYFRIPRISSQSFMRAPLDWNGESGSLSTHFPGPGRRVRSGPGLPGVFPSRRYSRCQGFPVGPQ